MKCLIRFMAIYFATSSLLFAMNPMNTFIPNTPISASGVNQNFTEVETSVELLELKVPYQFPSLASGSNGQVLGWSAVGPQWIAPTMALTGITPINISGGVVTMTEANASNSGYLSPAMFNNFNSKMNFIAPGTAGSFLISDGGNWLPSSNIFMNTNKLGIGTSAPLYTFQVSPSPAVTEQALASFSSSFNQSSSTQTTLKVHGNVTKPSGQYNAVSVFIEGGAGAKKNILEASEASVITFQLNSQGYVTNGNGFMGKLSGVPNLDCPMATPTLAQHFPLASIVADFGIYPGYYAVDAGSADKVYEILLDISFPSPNIQPHLVLRNNLTPFQEIRVINGRNIKRLPQGQWVLQVGCQDPSDTTNNVVNSANSVFGIRRLH